MKFDFETKRTLLKNTAWVSGVAAAVLALLLILNTIQTSMIDPLNTPALTQLTQELRENPDDSALRQEIRALDLLARRAYFSHLWQVRAGTFLLFVFVLAALISLKLLQDMRSRDPEFDRQENLWASQSKARKSLFIGAGALFLIAFVAGITAESQFSGQAEQAFPSEEDIRENWPAFRGPFGNGHAFVDSPPLNWNGEEDENIRWKVPIPLPGYNSPVVWDERVYLSGADEENRVIYCFDAKSGDLRWQADVSDLPDSPDGEPDVTDDTGYAAPTMTTDGTAVYAVFANGDLVALNMDGKKMWSKSLGLPDNHYGHSSSLILYQSVLIVQWDQGDEQFLYGFNKQSGQQVYQVPRDVQISWSSPICINTGSRDEVIINAAPNVMGHDPMSGTELWRGDGMMGEVAPSPAYADGMVFAVNEYAVLLGIELDTPAVAWEFDRGMSEVSSPVASEIYLIMGTSYGSLYCFDAKSGETLWVHEFDDGFYSSPIIAGDRVYIMDMSGMMHVIQLADEFEVIAENPLGESGLTTPAFYKDRVYIRGDEHLFCVQE